MAPGGGTAGTQPGALLQAAAESQAGDNGGDFMAMALPEGFWCCCSVQDPARGVQSSPGCAWSIGKAGSCWGKYQQILLSQGGSCKAVTNALGFPQIGHYRS